MFPITGITVVSGPPVGVAHIRLTRGLNLVYGVNGVGKSRTLDAIASTLRGWGPGGNTPTDRCTRALYASGGIHFSAPISILSSSDQAFRVLAECVGLGPDLATSISFSVEGENDAKDRYETAWSMLDTHTLRAQLAKAAFAEASWANATIEECERLVDDGHWLITPGGDIFVSASASTTGSLDWLADNSDWNISIERLKEFGQFEWGTNQQDDGRTAEWGFADIGRNVRDRLPPHPYLLGMDCPEWLSIPVACVGGLARDYSIDDGPTPHPLEQLFSLGVEANPEDRTKRFFDRDKQTRDWLLRRTRTIGGVQASIARTENRSILLDKNSEITKEFRQATEEIESAASRFLAEFFDDAPKLSVRIDFPDKWFEGQQPIQWKARTSGGVSIPLNQLGSAHRRFADFAIQRALRTENWNLAADSPDTSSIALIDEPERALHRLGEAKVFAGLRNLADIVIAATHSPALIADSSVNLIHVAPTSSGLVSITSHIGGFSGSHGRTTSEIANELGISVTDLLCLVKVIVLVEGEHDELMINALCPEVSMHADVRVLRLGGVRGLAQVPETEFLFEMTDATILVATDNARNDWIAELEAKICDRTTNTALQGFLASARKTARGPEEKLLIGLLGTAATANQLDRIKLFGFSKRDIAEYLPVELICPEFRSWKDASNAFLSQTGRSGWSPGDGSKFKEWIRGKPGGKYHSDGIAEILNGLEAQWSDSGGASANRHSDFTDLAEEVQRLR
jgi:hypothetical protein